MANREVAAARVRPSAPATLVAPVDQTVEGAGGGGLSAHVIPPASTLKAKDKKKGRVARGGPSVPVIPATTPSGPGTMITGGGLSAPVTPVTTPIGPGTMTVGGGLSVPRTLPVRRPGNGPETAVIETPTFNAVLPGPGTVTRPANSPAGLTMPEWPLVRQCQPCCHGGSLQGRLRGLGATPLSAVRVGTNRIPPTPQRVGWMEPGQRAVGGFTPPAEEIRANAMIVYPTTDSTFWPESNGCVWRRIPVIHRATGAFAILYSRVIFGGAGVLQYRSRYNMFIVVFSLSS